MGEMSKIEEVALAISNVALWSRMNDWTSDRVEGFPVEICRYGLDDEPEIVVVRRFPTGTNETEALTMVVAEERGRAAIEAMRKPDNDMLRASFEAMFVDKWDGTQAAMMGTGWEAGIDAALKE